MSRVPGAVIDHGAADWQVLQQNERGTADLALKGRWDTAAAGARVELRLVREDTGGPVAAHLDWTPADTRPDGTWTGALRNVPAGGLYRLETHLRTKDQPAVEWSTRGDMRHFLGVGDLWIIAGQSNSAGYGREPCDDAPELGVHVFNNAMRWALATQPLNDSTDTAHPANRENANSGNAPWLHWARRIKQAMGFPIGLIQTSLGGSALAPWNPVQGGKHPLFQLMVKAVAAAGGRAKGMLWYQGESDCGPEDAPRYERRFAAAVRAWRAALHCPRLHVLTVQLNRYAIGPDEQADRDWSLLRQAQRSVARRMPGVSVVPALDLPLADAIHNSSHGNRLLAERAAATALGAAYGRPVDYKAPEPVSACRDAEGTTIEIVFENVASRIECFHQNSVPFRVEDARGVVPIEAAQYPGGNKVVLRLARAALGKAVVHGGYGRNPPPPPYDMVRFVPMLAFWGLAVE